MTGKNEYGNALFLLARDEGTVETVKTDLDTAIAAINENPHYVKLLDTPAIAKTEKLSLIDAAFSTLHYSVVNVLKILCEKHVAHSLNEVASTYSQLYDEYNGIERVEAVTAIPLSASQEEAIIKKLSSMTGKRIILKNTVDAKILGGITLRYSGIQLDGSVKSRLDAFSKSLKNLNL